ncbi:MAG: hypothetical protein WBB98_04605 [Xanthobacteraceae bacterium]
MAAIDLLSGFPGWSTTFELLWRQETSRAAGGRTYVKDLGDPLWTATYQTRLLKINELDYWRARLDQLENGAGTFYGRALSRCRPILHPGSSTLPTGTLSGIGTYRKTLTITGLTGITLSVGDMLQVGTADLHRVVVAGSSVEVRPTLWPGVTTGAAVVISKPSCIMAIVPGSINTQAAPDTGDGTVTFQAMEAR